MLELHRGGGCRVSGDDVVVGRTNTSEDRTLLLAINGENAPGGYGEDFVLNVATDRDKVLVSNPRGVDGIHTKGTFSFRTGPWRIRWVRDYSALAARRLRGCSAPERTESWDTNRPHRVTLPSKPSKEQAAVLESARMAQLWLVPLRIENPRSLARSNAGELLATVWADREERGIDITSLWFCKIGGDPKQANWVKLA